ncbi:MAG: TetR/AcrR family transcriptional regulator [Coprobacillaceae bacterium]
MAKPDTSIDPRILESAKVEFLANGYNGASLKTICANAAVTTGALYKRYSGKAELFEAVVAPMIYDLEEIVNRKRVLNIEEVSNEELIKAWDMDEEYMLWWFQFLYERYDGFILLLCRSEGSSYSNFSHEWVEKMTVYTYEYFLEAYKRGLTTVMIEKSEMHILLSAFWSIIYEPFILSYTWQEMVTHSNLVCKLFNWYKVLGFESDE